MSDLANLVSIYNNAAWDTVLVERRGSWFRLLIEGRPTIWYRKQTLLSIVEGWLMQAIGTYPEGTCENCEKSTWLDNGLCMDCREVVCG